MQRNLALLRPRYQSGAGKVKFQTATKMEKDRRGIFPRMLFHQLDISEGKRSKRKGAAYGPRTIQSTIFFRKFLPNHLHPINLCPDILAPSAGGRLFAGCSSTYIPEIGSGVFPVFRCLVWRGADLSAERGRLRACGVRYYEILIK